MAQSNASLAVLIKFISEAEKQTELARQSLAEQKLFEPYTAFRRLDQKRQGGLKLEELIEYLDDNHIQFTNSQLNYLFYQLDLDADGVISYNDFNKALIPKNNMTLKELVTLRDSYFIDVNMLLPNEVETNLAKLFQIMLNNYNQLFEAVSQQQFDLSQSFEGNPNISPESLYNFMQENEIEFDDEDLAAFYRAMDPSQQQQLSLEEFENFIVMINSLADQDLQTDPQNYSYQQTSSQIQQPFPDEQDNYYENQEREQKFDYRNKNQNQSDYDQPKYLEYQQQNTYQQQSKSSLEQLYPKKQNIAAYNQYDQDEYNFNDTRQMEEPFRNKQSDDPFRNSQKQEDMYANKYEVKTLNNKKNDLKYVDDSQKNKQYPDYNKEYDDQEQEYTRQQMQSQQSYPKYQQSNLQRRVNTNDDNLKEFKYQPKVYEPSKYDPPIQKNFEQQAKNYELTTKNFEQKVYERPGYEPPNQNYEALSKSYEVTSKNYELQQKNYEPQIKVYEPQIKGYEPQTKNFDPRNKNYEPITKVNESVAKIQEPVTKSYEPPRKNYDPAPKNYEIVNNAYEPAPKNQIPSYSHKQTSEEFYNQYKQFDQKPGQQPLPQQSVEYTLTYSQERKLQKEQEQLYNDKFQPKIDHFYNQPTQSLKSQLEQKYSNKPSPSGLKQQQNEDEEYFNKLYSKNSQTYKQGQTISPGYQEESQTKQYPYSQMKEYDNQKPAQIGAQKYSLSKDRQPSQGGETRYQPQSLLQQEQDIRSYAQKNESFEKYQNSKSGKQDLKPSQLDSIGKYSNSKSSLEKYEIDQKQKNESSEKYSNSKQPPTQLFEKYGGGAGKPEEIKSSTQKSKQIMGSYQYTNQPNSDDYLKQDYKFGYELKREILEQSQQPSYLAQQQNKQQQFNQPSRNFLDQYNNYDRINADEGLKGASLAKYKDNLPPKQTSSITEDFQVKYQRKLNQPIEQPKDYQRSNREDQIHQNKASLSYEKNNKSTNSNDSMNKINDNPIKNNQREDFENSYVQVREEVQVKSNDKNWFEEQQLKKSPTKKDFHYANLLKNEQPKQQDEFEKSKKEIADRFDYIQRQQFYDYPQNYQADSLDDELLITKKLIEEEQKLLQREQMRLLEVARSSVFENQIDENQWKADILDVEDRIKKLQVESRLLDDQLKRRGNKQQQPQQLQQSQQSQQLQQPQQPQQPQQFQQQQSLQQYQQKQLPLQQQTQQQPQSQLANSKRYKYQDTEVKYPSSIIDAINDYNPSRKPEPRKRPHQY